MNAVIYARYSSHAQNDASIEQQITACRQYADSHGFTVVGEYHDRALSGTSDKRPEFLRMIRDSARKKWERVIVYKLDRFARNRYDSATYKARLKKNGVFVVSAMEPIPEGPEGILLESILEGSAEYYSANLSQNVLRGMYDNARQCKTNNGALPLGYKKGTDGRYELDPERVPLVKEIFSLYDSENLTYREIADLLNSRGVRTSKNKPFSVSTVSKILSNERYLGIYLWKDVRIEDGIPRIIDNETFHRVQERKKKLAHSPGSGRSEVSYMLTGKLFCGKCGGAMTGLSGTGEHRDKHYYYVCSSKRRFHTCDKTNVSKQAIEDAVVDLVCNSCLDDKMINTVIDAALKLQKEKQQRPQLKALQSDLKGINKKLENLMRAIEDGIYTQTTKERLSELETQKRQLEEAISIEELSTPTISREVLTLWFKRFRTKDRNDPDFRARLIEMFVHKVFLYDDKLIITTDLGNGTTKDNTISLETLSTLSSSTKEKKFDLCFNKPTNTNKGELSKAFISLESVSGFLIISVYQQL